MLIDILPQYVTSLDAVTPNMIFYCQFESQLRGRRHQNTFFCTFTGEDKPVFEFFRDLQLEIGLRLAAMQSWETFQLGFLFVKLFPPPYVVMFIPTAFPGLWLEPACLNKEQAVVSFTTGQTGRKRWMRKFLFGMPASWIDGRSLTPEGQLRIFSKVSAWEQMWTESYTDWPYTMGKMNRYIDGSYRSPLNPINYWPLEKMYVRGDLVKHRHAKRSQRWPNLS